MEETPQNTTQPTPLEKLLKPPHLYGLASIALMGLASFFFVITYLGNAAIVPTAQTAVAAEASKSAFADISVEGKSAIVVDLKTGAVLYEKNSDAQLPLASITKVMLTLAVTESLPGDTVITIPYDTAPKGSAERLAKGEKWNLQDVINFTLIASSNEGANILADAADDAIRNRFPSAPAEHATVWRMNTLAQEIGMRNSYFLNDNGLDLSASQAGAYSSARDIALMFSYAASTSPHVFTATAENGLLLEAGNGKTTSAFNTNEALGDISGLIMGKTGFTDLAGGNLAVVFDVGLAHPVVAVVLGSSHEGRFADMKKLVAAARNAVAHE